MLLKTNRSTSVAISMRRSWGILLGAFSSCPEVEMRDAWTVARTSSRIIAGVHVTSLFELLSVSSVVNTLYAAAAKDGTLV